jgi:hypothetical protein
MNPRQLCAAFQESRGKSGPDVGRSGVAGARVARAIPMDGSLHGRSLASRRRMRAEIVGQHAGGVGLFVDAHLN